MKLKRFNEILITPSVPFNFDATFFKPDHFTTDDHEYIEGIRWQTMNWKGQKLGLKFMNAGSVYKPKVVVEAFGPEDSSALNGNFIKSLKKEITYRFNLHLDIKGFYEDVKADKLLKNAIQNLEGMRPGHPSSLYEYLIIGIILQNASVRRSIQMFRNLLSKYGDLLEFDGKKLFCLWEAGRFSNVDEMELRELKVGYRAKSIKRLDEQFAKGLLNEDLMRTWDVESQKKSLLSLYGVGPATVWYLLFDVFHNWAVFEHISPWEQKLYSQLFFEKELVPVEELMKYIDKFGEYKHLAVHYLWEDLWWRRYNGESIDWLEREIRV